MVVFDHYLKKIFTQSNWNLVCTCNPIQTWCVHAIQFKLGVSSYWVSVQSWFAFGAHWPNFGPLVATKWLKIVVSNHYLKKYSRNPPRGVLEFVTGGQAWPDSVTSKVYIRGGDWKKGSQNSTMTTNARKEGSIFYISMKSLPKRGSKIYNSIQQRAQNPRWPPSLTTKSFMLPSRLICHSPYVALLICQKQSFFDSCIDGLVQKRRNSIANALDYVFLALTHRHIFNYNKLECLRWKFGDTWQNGKKRQ